MDCIVHGAAKSWTRLSNVHFHFQCLRAGEVDFHHSEHESDKAVE